MPKPGEEFNIDAVIREASEEEPEVVEAVEEAGPAAAKEGEEEVVEATAQAEEEDDDKWAQAQAAKTGGKAIALESFQGRLKRWQAEKTKLLSGHQATQAELEAIRKSQPLSADDVQKYKTLQGVFGNLDNAAREMPWLEPLLLAVGAGKKPDWEKVKADMEAYLTSVPKGDPILYQQMQELRQQTEELQTERMASLAKSHVADEDVEIAKILGDRNDPVAAQYWAILNEHAKAIFDASNPKSLKDAPNRVQLAKRLVAASEAYAQKSLKKALPPPNRPKANIGTGNGGSGGAPAAKPKPNVDINSKEMADFILNGSPS